MRYGVVLSNPHEMVPSIERGTPGRIELDNISMQFDGVSIFRNVSLQVSPGEFVCIMGRSGSGKSTLLRIAAGLLTAQSGRVNVEGESAFGFQDSRLVPWIRVWKNIVLGMTGSRQQLRKSAAKALDDVQLAGYDTSWPSQLSGGQAQRASLARALVRQPSILLLDEPFGALDALTRIDMQNLLADLCHKHHWTVLMVTHDMSEAIRLADRIVVLSDGKLQGTLNLDRSHSDRDGYPQDRSAYEQWLRDILINRSIRQGDTKVLYAE